MAPFSFEQVLVDGLQQPSLPVDDPDCGTMTHAEAKPKAQRPRTSDHKPTAADAAAGTRVKERDQRAKTAAAARRRRREQHDARRRAGFERQWQWTAGFWLWMAAMHAVGMMCFTRGFLLTRLVLDNKSACEAPPVEPDDDWPGRGTVDGGCWRPRTFARAVVVVIDALRYDFTVPADDDAPFHNAFPFLHETAARWPDRAVLRPFIADPPTSTLQRLKGLTTGTLPTFVDLGSSFAGTAVAEDNMLAQLRGAGKRLVHLGDDTWEALFPGHFEANMSKAEDSFNVWDLHTVDQSVADRILPLLDRTDEWDVLIGHCLGVDHAGHRYGPNHAAMTGKLAQMDGFVRDLAAKLDQDTLLVVMGDHGMDNKGDHGGESDDEVEAALWLYSSKPVFGRSRPEFAMPPATAKTRPVNQIDLVPTLSLLLGIPIPFNNLGRPIEEAFAGANGTAWEQLVGAERVAAAGTRRYQAAYMAARGTERPEVTGSAPAELWARAEALAAAAGTAASASAWRAASAAFVAYQQETLRMCRARWARFDVPNMVLGIAVMALGVVCLLVFVSHNEPPAKLGVLSGLAGGGPGLAGGLLYACVFEAADWHRAGALAALMSLVAVLAAMHMAGHTLRGLVPSSLWTCMAVALTASPSVGLASNSYTVWEDAVILFLLATFGLAAALASFRLGPPADRHAAVSYSLLFVVLVRVASYSRLCREEQMPHCWSTYYASATSSTSAPWQLAVPYAVALLLPSVVKAFLASSRAYDGPAPAWIGSVFRAILLLSAVYWTVDAADNASWLPFLAPSTLKKASVYGAQTILGVALVAGPVAFVWAPPCISLATAGQRVAVLGFANAHGARYLLLPLNLMAACFILSKPMGGGALALLVWQCLCLAEILDRNGLSSSPVGPVVLALLGTLHYFKTGHQATLSSIQWDAAFVALFSVRYPWSPLFVALNHFAGQIVAVSMTPLLALWNSSPRKTGVLSHLTRALGLFVAHYAVEAAATMVWAALLRRHLMLYRVFSPRFMMAAAALAVVDVVGFVVALVGARTSMLSVADLFGWPV